MRPFSMKKSSCVFVIIFLAVFISLNFAVLKTHGIAYPVERTEIFEEDLRTDYRARIDVEKPRVIAIGDSAIRELSPDSFSAVLGQKTLIFSAPGSGSAYWYLFFRHQVLTAEQPPQVMLFFFRSLTLTEPAYLVDGSYRTRLEETASAMDADVYALAIGRRQNPSLKIPERYIPLFAFRSEIYRDLVARVRNAFPGFFLGCDAACVDSAFDQVFDETQINAILWEELVRELDNSLAIKENFDFKANVGDSLLPLMLRDARRAGITPVFVRVQYRSQACGEPDSIDMAAYMQDLRHYVQQNGGLFIDLANVDMLTADMYRDEIHLNLDDAPAASAIIAQDIADQLEFLPRN